MVTYLFHRPTGPAIALGIGLSLCTPGRATEIASPECDCDQTVVVPYADLISLNTQLHTVRTQDSMQTFTLTPSEWEAYRL